MKKLLLSFGVFVLLAGAGSLALPYVLPSGPRTPVIVEPPDYPPEGIRDAPTTEKSRIAVRLEMPLDALAAAANKNAPDQISGAEQKDFHSRLKNTTIQWLMQPGDISLQNTGQNLAFSLPIRGVARVNGELDAMILRLPIQGDADLGGRVVGTVAPQITTDWVIEPNLQPELILSHADLTLGTIGSISATGMIQDLANPIIKKEAANVGPSIMAGLNLQKNLQRFWDEAHRGEQVSTDPPAWFAFDPSNVSMGPIDYSRPGSLSVTMGMEADSYVSAVPVNLSYPETLPPLDLQLTDPVNDIRVPVIVNIEELNKKLSPRSFSQSFGVAGKATIERPEIRVGRKGFLLFGVSVDADTGKFGRGFTGRIWVEVRPEFDFETQTIRLTDVGLTEKTRQALPRPAVSMIENLVVKSIEKELQADLNRYLPELEKEIQKYLDTASIPEDIEIAIPEPNVQIREFYTVTRTAGNSLPSPGIVVVIGARGDITVKMKTLTP
ncbi:MAG: DUF4403 family protein [Verrucomicrobiales bacterium]|nr:DUF4403 family protein [Verrucomicrobiales bacterium]